MVYSFGIGNKWANLCRTPCIAWPIVAKSPLSRRSDPALGFGCSTIRLRFSFYACYAENEVFNHVALGVGHH